jgi:hypothetical protein
MMTRQKCWLSARLAVALCLEVLFLAFVLPWCVKDVTYRAEVWKDFFVGCGAVLVLYAIWPVFRAGGTCLKILAMGLCLFPVWLLGWVIMQHFDLVPRWFS